MSREELQQWKEESPVKLKEILDVVATKKAERTVIFDEVLTHEDLNTLCQEMIKKNRWTTINGYCMTDHVVKFKFLHQPNQPVLNKTTDYCVAWKFDACIFAAGKVPN